MINYGLAGKTICVTGGASGLGLATVRRLLADDARVAILDNRQAEIDAAIATLEADSSRLMACALDVRDCAAISSAADRIEATLGPIYGLVASAGISGAAKAEDMPEEEFAAVLSVNVTGLFLCCQDFGRRMIGHGGGSIVTIGSIDGIGGQAGRTHYVASKFAVRGVTQNLAIEWGRHNVRVNCVAPGFTDTPLLRKGVPSSFIDEVVTDRTPMKRMVRPDEVATVILALLSDAMAFVTGTTIAVDGGLTTGFTTASHGADLSSTRLLEAGIYP